MDYIATSTENENQLKERNATRAQERPGEFSNAQESQREPRRAQEELRSAQERPKHSNQSLKQK